jgi:hypothetical protein
LRFFCVLGTGYKGWELGLGTRYGILGKDVDISGVLCILYTEGRIYEVIGFFIRGFVVFAWWWGVYFGEGEFGGLSLVQGFGGGEHGGGGDNDKGGSGKVEGGITGGVVVGC